MITKPFFIADDFACRGNDPTKLLMNTRNAEIAAQLANAKRDEEMKRLQEENKELVCNKISWATTKAALDENKSIRHHLKDMVLYLKAFIGYVDKGWCLQFSTNDMLKSIEQINAILNESIGDNKE